MKARSFILYICIIYHSFNIIHAQLSTNELPFSFNSEKALLLKQKNIGIKSYEFILPKTVEQLSKEDSITDYPPRFGYPIPVNLNMTNSGIWPTLENGDKLWQTEISSPGALSISLSYDKFWIPKNAKLFLYSKDKKQYLGAFTYINNKGDSINLRGFITDLIYSDKIIIEYYQPVEVRQTAIISIDNIIHGYKYIDFTSALNDINEQKAGFGQAENC